mgnify:CR=1 FL=1
MCIWFLQDFNIVPQTKTYDDIVMHIDMLSIIELGV